MDMDEVEIIRLKSGRRVALHQLAKGSRQQTIVFCHPAPGAGNLNPDPEETTKRQVTLISVDRPGYGDSETIRDDEWVSVATSADNLDEVLKQSNIGQVGVAGWSAGGRVALALAARHPNLVDRVAIIGTPAPDEIVPWIPAEQKQVLENLRDLPPAKVHQELAAQFSSMLSHDSSNEALLSLIGYGPADAKILVLPGASNRLLFMLQAAFAKGTAGLAADVAGYCLQSWGFEPAQVQAKTLCLYGSKDPIANLRHGNWWQKNLPNARLEMAPDAGHLLIIPMWRRVLSHLAPGRQ